MNFAPYQSSPPETSRALSPPRRSQTASPSKQPRLPSPSNFREEYQNLENPSPFEDETPQYRDQEAGLLNSEVGRRQGGPDGVRNTDVYQTSLPFRMEIEAALAYIVFPPAGGMALLVFERKSDYVRFHAWQSTLLFSVLAVLHLLLSWSSFLSWVLLIGDSGAVGFLAWHAYKDAETLDRVEVPFIGPLASSFVDRE